MRQLHSFFMLMLLGSVVTAAVASDAEQSGQVSFKEDLVTGPSPRWHGDGWAYTDCSEHKSERCMNDRTEL